MKDKKDTSGGNFWGYVILIAAIILLAIVFSDGGGSSSHKSRYSQLSPQEKANAEWAYEVQKELNERN